MPTQATMSEEDSNKEAKGATEPSNMNPGSAEKQRRDRLEQNRISARESRKRKKTMIEELQRTVITLSKENKDLNERNESLRRELVEIGTKHPGLVPIQALMRGGALAASATEETDPAVTAADPKDESASSGAGSSNPTTMNPLLPQPQAALSAPNAQQQMALMQQMMMMQQMNPAFMGMMQGMAAQQAAQAGQQQAPVPPQAPAPPPPAPAESDAAPAENGAKPAESADSAECGAVAPKQENPADDVEKSAGY